MIAGIWASNLNGECPVGTTSSTQISDSKTALIKRISAHQPLTLVAILVDQDFNNAPKMQTPYAVGVGDTIAWFEQAGSRPLQLRGARTAAESLVKYAIPRGFDIGKAEEVALGSSSLPIGNELAALSGLHLIPILLNPRIGRSRPIRRYLDLAMMIEEFLELHVGEAETFGVYASGATSYTPSADAHGPDGTIDKTIRRLSALIEAKGDDATLADLESLDGANADAGIVWLMANAISKGGAPSMITFGEAAANCRLEAIEIASASHRQSPP